MVALGAGMRAMESGVNSSASRPPSPCPSSPPKEEPLISCETPENIEDRLGDERLVMSEVHLGCPPGVSGPHISCFSISLPSEFKFSRFEELFEQEESSATDEVVVDEDGDLVLPRRKTSRRCFGVKIQHNITSPIPSVGLQVWKAELVLADFILHKICASSEFDGVVALELGAGTGLAGILLAHVAKTVFLTDYGDKILDNCCDNIQLNSRLFSHQSAVCVRELDWSNPWPPETDADPQGRKWYSWTPTDLEDLEKASVLIAADVIYSDDLTGALFRILERLMQFGSEKVLYLALEKRYNFSLNDLDIVANGYSCFKSYLMEDKAVVFHAAVEYPKNESLCCFIGKQINLTEVPQCLENYDRGKDLELWQIRYHKR